MAPSTISAAVEGAGSNRSRRAMRRARIGLTVGGAALSVAALAFDHLTPRHEPSLGAKQWAVVALGLGTALGARLLSDRMFRRLLLLPAVVAASTYVALFAFELALIAGRSPPKQSGFVQGLYTPDPERGYCLSKSFRGVDDDGHVRVTYRTNSRGDRDDELVDPAAQTMLLVGDSFTFGLRLDDDETIDRQVEKISRQRCYNIGVPGYGLPAIRKSLEANDWFAGSGREVIYLFCNNDLSTGDLHQYLQLTAYDGYIVPRLRADGGAYSPADYEDYIRRRFHPPFLARLLEAIRLTCVGELIASRIQDVDLRYEYPAENVEQALAEIAAMSRVARSRGCSFRVALIPSLYETTRRRTASSTAALMAKLQAAGIAILDLAQHLEPTDYFAGEGHLDAAGARDVAAALLLPR